MRKFTARFSKVQCFLVSLKSAFNFDFLNCYLCKFILWRNWLEIAADEKKSRKILSLPKTSLVKRTDKVIVFIELRDPSPFPPTFFTDSKKVYKRESRGMYDGNKRMSSLQKDIKKSCSPWTQKLLDNVKNDVKRRNVIVARCLENGY